ncbi:MAG: hypothetical protein J6K97_03155 [Clostridia bacterium]|nr:hypothetical protein [Clostridia bacterium]
MSLINDKRKIIKALNEEKEKIDYASEEEYKKIYNLCSSDEVLIEYLDEQNYITSDDEDRVSAENSDSIDRLRYFIGDTYSAEIYRIDGYGNLENVTSEDLKDLCDDLIHELRREIQDLLGNEM